MNYVYCVLFDWSVEDDAQIETYIFKNYEDAVKKFKKLIETERKPDMSWVGDEAFNSAGKLNKGYFHHEFIDDSKGSDLYWQVGRYNEPCIYSFITLKKQQLL